MIKTILNIIGIALTLLSESAFAQFRIQPFYVHNQSPIIHYLGIPNNEGGNISLKGQMVFDSHFNLVSNANSRNIYNERIYLDGEMYRFDNSFRYGALEWLELGIDVPVVSHSGGIFDNIIDKWHNFFNMPAVAREKMPQDAIKYVYTSDGTDIIKFGDAYTGVGDISILGAVKFLKNAKHSLSIRSLIKLPTGNKKNLIGSGTTDIAIQLNGTAANKNKLGYNSLFYSGGMLYFGKGSFLEEIKHQLILYGSIGYSIRAFKRIIPKIQFDWHSAICKNSQVKQLGKTSVQMTTGFDIVLNYKTGFEFGVTEDILINRSPDIVFHFGFNRYF